jgi:hypothetical protein
VAGDQQTVVSSSCGGLLWVAEAQRSNLQVEAYRRVVMDHNLLGEVKLGVSDKRVEDCNEQYGLAFCKKEKGHPMPHEGVEGPIQVKSVCWGS